MKPPANQEKPATTGRRYYSVIFDDDMGMCAPMGWDADCDGALAYGEPVVVFPNRGAARKAIRISRLWNALLRERGETTNSDFDPEAVKTSGSFRLLLPDAVGAKTKSLTVCQTNMQKIFVVLKRHLPLRRWTR